MGGTRESNWVEILLQMCVCRWHRLVYVCQGIAPYGTPSPPFPLRRRVGHAFSYPLGRSRLDFRVGWEDLSFPTPK